MRKLVATAALTALLGGCTDWETVASDAIAPVVATQAEMLHLMIDGARTASAPFRPATVKEELGSERPELHTVE